MFLNVLSKCFQVPVPVVWKSFAEAGRRLGEARRAARPMGTSRLRRESAES